MRISSVENSAGFSGLQIQNKELYELGDSVIKKYKSRLSDTRHVDLVFDSHGFAIKKKMTDILQRVQSFSLFTQENSVGINVNSGEERVYKFKFTNLETAREVWRNLSETCRKSSIEGYTKIALMVDSYLATKASKENLKTSKQQQARTSLYC